MDQVAWNNDFGDSYVCTIVELKTRIIKKELKFPENYIHERDRRPFCEPINC